MLAVQSARATAFNAERRVPSTHATFKGAERPCERVTVNDSFLHATAKVPRVICPSDAVLHASFGMHAFRHISDDTLT
jgi:hypothetical protein